MAEHQAPDESWNEEDEGPVLQRRRMRDTTDMDITPMIDVTFLLMVFFMLVSAFNEMEREAVLELPEAYQALVKEDVAQGRTVVNIENDGSIIVFGKTMSIEQFHAQLLKRAAFLAKLGNVTGHAPIVLRGDKGVKFEYVREVIGAVYDARITKVMFAAYQRKEGDDRW